MIDKGQWWVFGLDFITRLLLLRLSAVISSALMVRGGYIKGKDQTQSLEIQFQAQNLINFCNAHIQCMYQSALMILDT